MCDACYANALLTQFKWDGPVTYAFPTSMPASNQVHGYPGDRDGWVPMPDYLAAEVREAVANWAAVADIGLLETADATRADILFNVTTNGGGVARAAYPPFGDVWFAGNVFGDGPTEYLGWLNPGSYGSYAILHEIGHALGLKHPEYGTDLNHVSLSIMGFEGTSPGGEYYDNPQSPMLYDIAAVQELYGPNWSHNSGDTIYSWNPKAGTIFETVWDGGGFDTYDLSAYRTGLRIDLRPGSWSTFSRKQVATDWWGDHKPPMPGSVANALLFYGDERSLIEAAIGGRGDDILFGNQADNHLYGGRGQDKLCGLEGDDHLVGGKGKDTLFGGSGADTFVVSGKDKIGDYNPSEGDLII